VRTELELVEDQPVFGDELAVLDLIVDIER